MCVGVGFWALLGLSAEDLPIKPSHPRQGLLKLVSQLGDLGLLTANDLFEALSFVLESRFPFGGTGMQRPPVVCPPAKLDFPAPGFGILNSMPAWYGPHQCVFSPRSRISVAPKDNHGFTEYLR